MMVCAHGDVAAFCEERGWVICDVWNSDIVGYNGTCRVVVTDSDISEYEYYFLKSEFLARGVELISTRYTDNKILSEYLVYAEGRRRKKYGGRPPFGHHRKGGDLVPRPESVGVIMRIRELRKAGLTLRAIREDEGVRHADGRKLSLGTIQRIIDEE